MYRIVVYQEEKDKDERIRETEIFVQRQENLDLLAVIKAVNNIAATATDNVIEKGPTAGKERKLDVKVNA